jgi:electron transfer flavoprotein beta subunit
MQIVVCIKQVLDPEMPYSAFKIDPVGKRAIPPQGTPPVISPYDENALEAALRVKDMHEAKVIALSLGSRIARPVLNKPLAAGVDELVLIEDPAADDLDSFESASILAAAIRKIGGTDVVFTGRQAADWDAGIAGCAIAEELKMPCITVARKVSVQNGMVRVERLLSDGFEVVEALLPCVITVDSDLGELRQVTMQGLNSAKKKPVNAWKLSDLELESPPLPRCELLELYIPKRKRVCQIISGENAEDKAVKLANRLFEESRL